MNKVFVIIGLIGAIVCWIIFLLFVLIDYRISPISSFIMATSLLLVEGSVSIRTLQDKL